MIRRLSDFTESWSYEVEATLKLFRILTDASLNQAVTPDGRTLGRIAWHITQTLGEMGQRAGLTFDAPGEEEPIPPAARIAPAYESGAKALGRAVTAQWTDAMLDGTVEMYGEMWPRGRVLSALIAHQIHHRGQLTVLMRQAGLTVPGIYGPAKEEWAVLGMPTME